MTKEISSFSDLVEQRLASLGTNAFAAEQSAGLPPDAIRNVMRSQKKDGPSISRAREICEAIGLEFYIGPKREMLGFAEPAQPSDLSKVEALRGGYLPIPWLDATTIRGSSPFAISRSWLASNGLTPDNLRAVEPITVHLSFPFDGKPVALIDTAAPRRGSANIWAYRDEKGIQLGRAAFDGELVIVFSADNQGPVHIHKKSTPNGIVMLGLVVWIGGRV